MTAYFAAVAGRLHTRARAQMHAGKSPCCACGDTRACGSLRAFVPHFVRRSMRRVNRRHPEILKLEWLCHIWQSIGSVARPLRHPRALSACLWKSAQTVDAGFEARTQGANRADRLRRLL